MCPSWDTQQILSLNQGRSSLPGDQLASEGWGARSKGRWPHPPDSTRATTRCHQEGLHQGNRHDIGTREPISEAKRMLPPFWLPLSTRSRPPPSLQTVVHTHTPRPSLLPAPSGLSARAQGRLRKREGSWWRALVHAGWGQRGLKG